MMDFTIQELFAEIGEKGQEILKNKTVTIIGIGGVGSTVIQILARNGINLRIIDKGRILEKDLVKQSLYRLDDVTKFKAKQAKKLIEEINQHIKVKTFHEDLTKNNVFLVEADVILDLSNDMATSEFVNEFAIEKKIPLLFSNYSGAKGHVLLVDRLQCKKGPCVACIKDKLEFKSKKTSGVFSPVTYALAALIASVTIKTLLNIKQDSKLLSIDIMKTELKHEVVEKNAKCKVCSEK